MRDVLMLPAEITIYVIADLRAAWLAWLDAEAGADLPVDAMADGQAVAEVDAAGMQCLTALSNSLQSRGRRLQVQHPSEVLELACRRLGLSHLLVQQGVHA